MDRDNRYIGWPRERVGIDMEALNARVGRATEILWSYEGGEKSDFKERAASMKMV